jgi:phosphoribosylformylglycinamidine synthase subunit PurS
MMFRAKIEIRLKKQEFDPEGETVKRSLQDLNFQAVATRISKVYDIVLEAPSRKEADSLAKSMCIRLLANPTKDDFSFEVSEIGTSSS